MGAWLIYHQRTKLPLYNGTFDHTSNANFSTINIKNCCNRVLQLQNIHILYMYYTQRYKPYSKMTADLISFRDDNWNPYP